MVLVEGMSVLLIRYCVWAVGVGGLGQGAYIHAEKCLCSSEACIHTVHTATNQRILETNAYKTTERPNQPILDQSECISLMNWN